MTFTPDFIDFCNRHYGKLNPLTPTGAMRDFSQKDTQKILQDLNTCTSYQLEYIQDFAKTAKHNFDAHVAKLRNISAAKQNEINAYKQFFADLEAKLEKVSKDAGNNTNKADSRHSSYKPSALSGQSFYDSIMHILGYDATTVGASAIFFLFFSGLRFVAFSPYFEQLAEYNAVPAARRFNPGNLTTEQIKMNLDEKSTREQIIQAGFLPPPSLAHAFDVEFKTFMQKMGSVSKQEEERPNQLGRKLIHPG